MPSSVYVFLYMMLVFWITFSFFLFQYNVQHINVLQSLSLIDTRKNKKKKRFESIRIIFIDLGDKFSNIGKGFRFLVKEQELERKIALAGLRGELTVQKVLGLRFVTFALGLLIALLLSFLGFGLFLQFAMIMAGIFGPLIWIHMAAKRRQERIGLDLPEFLDSMSVSLQAGSPMDPAMEQIISSMDGPLSEELKTFQQEIELGVPREMAYRRLVDRNDSAEIEMLVQALLQGSKLGVPIANTFTVLAEDLRKKKMNLVKEKATKIGPKVTLIMVITILPSVLLLIVGLLILNIIYNPEGMGIHWNLFQ